MNAAWWVVAVGLSLSGARVAPSSSAETVRARLMEWAGLRAGGHVVPPHGLLQQAVQGQVPVMLATDSAGGSGTVVALALVDVAAQQMWKAAVDDDHQAGFLGLDESVVVAGRAHHDGYLSYQYVDLFGPFDRWWVTRTTYNSRLYDVSGGTAWEAEFQDQHQDHSVMGGIPARLKARGSPLKSARGSWLFVEVPEGWTYVQYTVQSHPGVVPASVAAQFSRGATRDAVKDLIRMAREHSPSCGGAYQRPNGEPL